MVLSIHTTSTFFIGNIMHCKRNGRVHLFEYLLSWHLGGRRNRRGDTGYHTMTLGSATCLFSLGWLVFVKASREGRSGFSHGGGTFVYLFLTSRHARHYASVSSYVVRLPTARRYSAIPFVRRVREGFLVESSSFVLRIWCMYATSSLLSLVRFVGSSTILDIYWFWVVG